MLKKQITYTNPFTEQEVTEEHHFHISKADLVEMEMEEHGATYEKNGESLTGMRAKLQRIIDSEDGKAIMVELKAMIRRSYGKKQGDRFVKSEEVWQEFSGSEAYSQLIFELCTNAEAAAQFMTGVVPNNLAQEAAKIAAQSVAISEEAETMVTVPPRVLQDGPPAEAHPDSWGNPSNPDVLVTEIEEKVLSKQPPRLLTRAELTEMDRDELQSGLATGRYKLS